MSGSIFPEPERKYTGFEMPCFCNYNPFSKKCQECNSIYGGIYRQDIRKKFDWREW